MNTTLKGKYIVIEGIDGSGKDTQIELLKDWPLLHDALFTRQPGGSKLGIALRDILNNADIEALPESELLLFTASRVQFMADIVLPALARKDTVISNRSALSTLAYQIYGAERMDLKDVYLSLEKTFLIKKPDVVILLDISAETAMQRIMKRANKRTRFEKRGLDYLKRVRDGYLKEIAHISGGITINGERRVSEINDELINRLQKI